MIYQRCNRNTTKVVYGEISGYKMIKIKLIKDIIVRIDTPSVTGTHAKIRSAASTGISPAQKDIKKNAFFFDRFPAIGI